MKFNYEFVSGVAYIASITGLAMGHVGQMSGTAAVYPWWLPIVVCFTILTPFILGYRAGKNK